MLCATGGGKDSKEDGGIFVVLHGIVRSSYVAPDGSANVRVNPICGHASYMNTSSASRVL